VVFDIYSLNWTFNVLNIAAAATEILTYSIKHDRCYVAEICTELLGFPAAWLGRWSLAEMFS